MNEDRLREALRAVPIPAEDEARERAWRVIGAARPASPTVGRARVVSRRGLRVALALALLLVAAISPAGAAVRDWFDERVGDGREPALPALTSLPAEGSLLVDSARGPWIVRRDGSKRLLGSYRQSTWSPRGLYVAATGGGELVALDPLGEVRWTVAREGPLGDPAWSPDGYRIAYRSGNSLRVVAGDGTGDHAVAAGMGAAAPAWRPGPGQVVSFADRGGDVRTVDADTGAEIGAVPAPSAPTRLEWSGSGSRLLVVDPDELRVFDRSGRALWRRSAPPGMAFGAASFTRDPDRVAATVTSRGSPARSELLLLGDRGPARRIFAGPGRFGDVVPSPGSGWLLLAWRSADQWLFLDVDRPQRVVAVGDIAAQFAPGATSAASFPRIAGWCCQGPPPPPAP